MARPAAGREGSCSEETEMASPRGKGWRAVFLDVAPILGWKELDLYLIWGGRPASKPDQS